MERLYKILNLKSQCLAHLVFYLFIGLTAISCRLDDNQVRGEFGLKPDTLSPTVAIQKSSGQLNSTPDLPIVYDVNFDEAIDPASFTTSMVTQVGTAQGVTWELSSTDNIHWQLKAINMSVSGTIEPSVDFSEVKDLSGNLVSDSSQDSLQVAHQVSFVTSPTQIGEYGIGAVEIFLNFPSLDPVNVDFATSSGTATDSVDYSGISGSLTFIPGSTSQQIFIPLFSDTSVEASENLFVDLSNPSGAYLPTSSLEVTIEDDDKNPVTGVADVSAGGAHTCLLKTGTNGIQCWGLNGSGQLGIGSNLNQSSPTDVVGLTSGVQKVASGQYHTCAMTASGAIKCWGTGSNGELGQGSTSNSTSPVDVTGFSSGATDVTTGNGFSCAINASGGAECWGKNNLGQLGDGTTTNRTNPVGVSGLSSGVVQIEAGSTHVCAVTSTGAAKCWGRNADGSLGDGTTTDSLTPVDVSGLSSGVVQIIAGDDISCARLTTGAVKCWGDRSNGKIGDGSSSGDELVPKDVTGMGAGVAQISSGVRSHLNDSGGFTCAVMSGAAKCWGSNDGGSVGNGSPITNVLVPTDVVGLSSGVQKVSAGGNHACAVMTSGELKCWGYNGYASLGTGWDPSAPQDVDGLTTGVSKIAAGNYHSCALLSGGGVKCWGFNFYGQLGDGTTADRATPVNVVGLASSAVDVRAGGTHTCALLDTGALQCWGYNIYGQIGDGTSTQRNSPVTVSGLSSGVTQVSLGQFHTCARLNTGGAKCWGRNGNGQLGNGTTVNSNTPVDVNGLTSGVTLVEAGGDFSYGHSCAILSSGSVKCWGKNSHGQLGDGTSTDSNAPVDATVLGSTVTQLSLGDETTCALSSDGNVKCVGDSFFFALGSLSGEIDLEKDITKIRSMAHHTCATDQGGALYCWGKNDRGQIGQSLETFSGYATLVPTMATGITEVAVGGTDSNDGTAHSCAVISTGALKCWGDNGFGQLGRIDNSENLIPQFVVGP